MNIFYLGYSLKESSGGIENYTYTILNHLKNQGHKIIVYTIHGKNENFENIDLKKIKLLDQLILGKRIGKILCKQHNDIDLFLCGHLFLAKYMEQLVKCFHKKYNLFVYGIDCWAGRFEQRYPKLKMLDKIISISSFTTEQILKQGFTGNIVYIPPVIDETKFEFVGKNIQNSNDTVKLITVGRLSSQEQYKGHDIVIQAIKLLVDQGINNLEYRIVGHGDDQTRLEKLVADLQIEKYVKFYGFVSDEKLKKVYCESDIFIMLSAVSLESSNPKGEGFGIVFIEAAMYKLPLIGPNVGGSLDIIDNRVNGFTINPKSPEQCANCITKLINDEKLRITFGKEARKKILNNFSTRQLDDYLNNLIQR